MAPNDFNWRIIDAIESLIDAAGLTRAEVIQRSGLRRNTFFVKMRGETALTTDDLSKIADALGVSPDQIVANASRRNVRALGDDLDMRRPRTEFGLAADESPLKADEPPAE